MKRSRSESDRSLKALPGQAPLARIGLTGADAPPPHDTNVPVLLIGGRRDCHVTVAHGDVSQIHAAIVNTGHALILVDLASRTGTFVNDVKVAVASIRPGDRVRVGPVPLGVQFKYPPTAKGDPTHLTKPLVLRWKEDEFRLDTLPAVIGRRQACAVLIDTPDISLAHALLLTINSCPAVMDLGSRSGTFVNDERVNFGWLRGGDDLRIGGEQMSIIWTGATAAAGAVVTTDRVELPQHAAASPVLATASNVGTKPVRRAAPQVTAVQPSVMPLQLPPAPSPVDAVAATGIQSSTEQIDVAAELDACFGAIEQQLFTLRGLLAARSDAIARRVAEAEARLAQLSAERQQHAGRFTQIAEQERALAERERALAERGHQLDDREQAVARRETATADASRKLEEIRTALDQASRGLTGVNVAALRPSGPVSAPGANTDSSVAKILPPRGDPPAPLVDRPLFGGPNGSTAISV